jgi:DNA-directed RNA polymerase specialized sigma24 family protein
MDQEMMGKDPGFERVLLSHVELCYSVALALTQDPNRAAKLAKETLSWAWQRSGGAQDADAIKMTLLSELRDRYVRQNRIARHRPASRLPQFEEAGV